jgi:predicted 3-demethylubiquinone-9 3-methyltransferase (glyoxalase superfamily)
MEKIISHLWFDKEAREAANFYLSAFDDSSIAHTTTVHDTPSGSVDVVSMRIIDHELQLISAGPLFVFNPSISLMVSCASAGEVDRLWQRLSPGGSPLMPLASYPFSPRYGWLQDRYGLSWQLMQSEHVGQRVKPVLMFVGDQCGRAEQAIELYTSAFPRSGIAAMARYEKGEGPDQEGTVKHARFSLLGQELAAMDSAHPHGFAFNEAFSLLVKCDTQEEIDHLWERLSADPAAEQCGWLKDQFGVSWQVVPKAMDEMLRSPDPVAVARVTQTFLKMKKFDLAKLESAYRG